MEDPSLSRYFELYTTLLHYAHLIRLKASVAQVFPWASCCCFKWQFTLFRKEAEDALRVCKEIFDKDGFRPDMTRFPCGKCCCLFQSCLCPKVRLKSESYLQTMKKQIIELKTLWKCYFIYDRVHTQHQLSEYVYSAHLEAFDNNTRTCWKKFIWYRRKGNDPS